MTGAPAARLRGERGMTLVEMCVVLVILGILMVIAVASLQRARVSANEASAIGSMKTINTAQIAYASSCGGGNFAPTLIVLGHKPPGYRQSFIEDDLGVAVTVQHSGYLVNIHDGVGASLGRIDCNGSASTTNYYANAIPVVMGKTGTRSFATSQRAGIYFDEGIVPPPEPFGPPSQLVQ
jgi:type IV pilus assembly protein PilA